jgi:hypothetical protein
MDAEVVRDVVMDGKVFKAIGDEAFYELRSDFIWEVEEMGYEIVQESGDSFVARKGSRWIDFRVL